MPALFRNKEKESRQGVLSVRPSDVARQAFEGEKPSTAGDGTAGGVTRTGTQIRYDNPNDIKRASQYESSTALTGEKPTVQDMPRTSQVMMSSPVDSESASTAVVSPFTSSIGTISTMRTSLDRPPTYSSRAESSVSRGSLSSHSIGEAPRNPNIETRETRSLSTRSTNSVGTHAVRVKTKGSQLSSGFPYPSSLFDMQVNPDKWASFTGQIVQAAKLSSADSSKAWAAATTAAMSGLVITSIYMKRTMDRVYQEEKVKTGISDMSDGGLGGMLQRWNDEYFTRQGLFVHLELSESAMKSGDQRSKILRKPSLLYSKEDRERKEDERKYVIVVTRLDADGAPTEAMRESESNHDERGMAAFSKEEPIAEMPGDTHQGFLIAELPGDDGLSMAELPGGVSLGFSSDKALQQPPGFAGLDSDAKTVDLLEKASLEEMEDTSRTVENSEESKLKTTGD